MTAPDGFFYAFAFCVIHWGAMLIAARNWPLQSLNKTFGSAVTLLLCILSCIVAFVCFFIFTDLNNRGMGAGHPPGWFLLFSMATFGILPAFTITAHVAAGRLVGWLLQKRAANNQ